MLLRPEKKRELSSLSDSPSDDSRHTKGESASRRSRSRRSRSVTKKHRFSELPDRNANVMEGSGPRPQDYVVPLTEEESSAIRQSTVPRPPMSQNTDLYDCTGKWVGTGEMSHGVMPRGEFLGALRSGTEAPANQPRGRSGEMSRDDLGALRSGTEAPPSHL